MSETNQFDNILPIAPLKIAALEGGVYSPGRWTTIWWIFVRPPICSTAITYIFRSMLRIPTW